MNLDTNTNILLVDDSAATRNMEAKLLAGLGLAQVTHAGDGREAVELMEAGQPVDLIISDWNMPGMDGQALLRWVRASDKYKDVAFIMATAQAEKEQERAARADGANAVIVKPFSSDELKRCLNQALSGEQEATTTARQPQVSPDGKLKLSVAHIQITDHLILGVLKHHIDNGLWKPKHFTLETQRKPGWNPVQEALDTGQVDAAFVLAPIAMDLFGYGCPIKLVLFAHKNGSIMVRSKHRPYAEPPKEFFRDSVFLIPHRLSVHHMLAHKFLSGLGLRAGVPGDGELDVRFEVVAPVKMPEFMASDQQTSGFMVAEPLGTNSIASGLAELQFLSGEAWANHPCCVVALRDEVRQQHPEAVQEFIDMLVKAGQFITHNLAQAAEVGVAFLDPEGKLGLSKSVLRNVLTENGGITTNDLLPVKADLAAMQDYMVEEMGVGSRVDLDKFVDLTFAEKACGRASQTVKAAGDGDGRGKSDSHSKLMLSREGKYLTYRLGDEDFGIAIRSVKEIIGMAPITPVPQTPLACRGVINLRGKVVPVIDLRLKFDMPEMDYHDRTCIIVVEVEGDASRLVGVVVDSVSEVLDIKADQIEPAPSFGGSAVDTSYIIGMAKAEGQGVKILLDIDNVLTDNQQEQAF